MCLTVTKVHESTPEVEHVFYKIVTHEYKSPCYPMWRKHWVRGAELEAVGDVEYYRSKTIYINGGVLHMFKSLEAALSHWIYFEDIRDRRIMACRVEDKDIVAWGVEGDVGVRRCTVLEEVVL